MGGMRKLLVLAALAGAAAVAAKKFMGRSQPVWHTPDTDATTEPVMSVVPDPSDDVAGASPDEALADAAEEPHRVTTPDSPLQETEVEPEE
jgi:hypothetical protein